MKLTKHLKHLILMYAANITNVCGYCDMNIEKGVHTLAETSTFKGILC